MQVGGLVRRAPPPIWSDRRLPAQVPHLKPAHTNARSYMRVKSCNTHTHTKEIILSGVSGALFISKKGRGEYPAQADSPQADSPQAAIARASARHNSNEQEASRSSKRDTSSREEPTANEHGVAQHQLPQPYVFVIDCPYLMFL